MDPLAVRDASLPDPRRGTTRWLAPPDGRSSVHAILGLWRERGRWVLALGETRGGEHEAVLRPVTARGLGDRLDHGGTKLDRRCGELSTVVTPGGGAPTLVCVGAVERRGKDSGASPGEKLRSVWARSFESEAKLRRVGGVPSHASLASVHAPSSAWRMDGGVLRGLLAFRELSGPPAHVCPDGESGRCRWSTEHLDGRLTALLVHGGATHPEPLTSWIPHDTGKLRAGEAREFGSPAVAAAPERRAVLWRSAAAAADESEPKLELVRFDAGGARIARHSRPLPPRTYAVPVAAFGRDGDVYTMASRGSDGEETLFVLGMRRDGSPLPLWRIDVERAEDAPLVERAERAPVAASRCAEGAVAFAFWGRLGEPRRLRVVRVTRKGPIGHFVARGPSGAARPEPDPLAGLGPAGSPGAVSRVHVRCARDRLVAATVADHQGRRQVWLARWRIDADASPASP